MTTFIALKDPDATLPYRFDWSAWLAGAQITSSQWIVPAGLTAVAEQITGDITVVTVAGGTAGEIYRLTNRVTTDDGRTDDRSLTLRVVER